MIMNTEQMETKLLTIIDGFSGQIPSEQLQDMQELVKSGERGIALENLCTQLYEYDIAVARDALAQIREIGQEMKIAPKLWEQLAIKEHQ